MSNGDKPGGGGGPRKKGRRTSSKLIVIASSSWARIVLTFVTSFFLAPMLLEELGIELFGILDLVLLTMAVAGPVRGAITKVLTRELTGALSAADAQRTRSVFTNGLVVASIATAVIALIGAALTVFSPVVIRSSPQFNDLVRVAVVCETILLIQTVILSPWLNAYIASHRMIAENFHRTLGRAFDLLAAILVFYWWTGLEPFTGYVVTRLALRTVQNLYRVIRMRVLERDLRFTPSTVDGAVMRDLAGTGGWSMGNQLARLGFFASDQLLLNWFFGPIYNGVYRIVNQLRGWTRMFGGNLVFGVDAVSADLHERGRAETGRMVLIATTKLSCAVTLIAAVLIGVFAAPIVEAWLGQSLEKRSDELLAAGFTVPQAIALVETFFFILLPGVVLSETNLAAANNLYGMGHIRRYSPVMIAASFLKIGLALALLFAGSGPLAIAWSTLIANFLCYGLYFPKLICDVTEMRVGDFLRRAYLGPALSCAPIAALGVGARLALGPMGWDGWERLEQLGALALLMGTLGALWLPLAFWLVCNAQERARIIEIVRHVRRVGLKQGLGGRRKRRIADEERAEEPDTPLT